MTKILTKLQKVFGATGPTGVLGQFGSFAEGSPVYTNDIETIQSLTEYGDGIASALVNGAPPAIQDINSLFYMISKQIAYLMQQGIPEWNSATTYYIGSFVTRPSGTNGEIFISVANDNLNNAITDTTKWMLYKSNKITAYSASNEYTAAYDDWYIKYNFATSATVYLPEPTSTNKGRSIHVYNANTVYPVVFKVGALGSPYSLIDNQQWVYLSTSGIVQGCFAKFISNGVSWDSVDGFYLQFA